MDSSTDQSFSFWLNMATSSGGVDFNDNPRFVYRALSTAGNQKSSELQVLANSNLVFKSYSF